MSWEKRRLKYYIEKTVNNDKYQDKRGDNYLYKNEWSVYEKDIKPSRGCNWKENQKWWVKNNDLNLHNGLKYKNLNEYEKTYPTYFDENNQKLYRYDNPLNSNLDKYNDQNFVAKTNGYSKNRKSVTASIERKRNKIV